MPTCSIIILAIISVGIPGLMNMVSKRARSSTGSGSEDVGKFCPSTVSGSLPLVAEPPSAPVPPAPSPAPPSQTLDLRTTPAGPHRHSPSSAPAVAVWPPDEEDCDLGSAVTSPSPPPFEIWQLSLSNRAGPEPCHALSPPGVPRGRRPWRGEHLSLRSEPPCCVRTPFPPRKRHRPEDHREATPRSARNDLAHHAGAYSSF